MFQQCPIDLQRSNETRDIVRRIKVIVAEDVILENHPIKKPITVFNPSLVFEDNEVRLFVRVALGYFTYASAIAELKFDFSDLTKIEKFIGRLILIPDNKYDVWGVEDPRAYRIDDQLFITYCGRTVNYFDLSKRTERALPITAFESNGRWKKILVSRLPEDLRSFVISDKDAFLLKNGESIKLFHRLHLKNEQFYLVLSDLESSTLPSELKEVSVNNTKVVLKAEKFEDKIGWGTPPIDIGKSFILFLHSVESETKAYKVFAIEMNKNLEVTATTPFYIMEPRENYERYGDRPFVVFPCGAELIDDKIIISYGAADSAVGLGEIDLSELLSILDKGRID
jgi:predicted GH43/DUF377 family glycosyl hydrolase